MGITGNQHLQAPTGSAGSARRVGEDEHYIPFRRAAIVDLLAQRLPADEQPLFGELAEVLSALLHHRFRQRIEVIKDTYHTLSPSPDVRRVMHFDDADRRDASERLQRELLELAERANFTRISDEELARAFDEEGMIKVRLEIDTGDIEKAMFFRRGELHRQRVDKQLLGLRRRTVAFRSYAKVLVYVKFKDEEHFGGRDVENLPFTPGSTMIKLFENVPCRDVEMLYPNVRVAMRLVDKLLIGVPAAISGVVVIATKLVASMGVLLLLIAFYLGLRDEPVELDQATLVSIGAGMAAFGGYLVRQFSKFKNRKIQFVKALSENLYFRNLDNDVGVFFHLLDAAEEAEVKEAVLAYHFLRSSPTALSAPELDERIESWFRAELDSRFDFEVSDGVRKLREFALADEREGKLTAVELGEATRRLVAAWDRVFEQAEPRGRPYPAQTSST
ncbi:MAG: TMEM143 family protein [Actinomycetota bacterium]|nr:TMEM143 family protein [Actinomycetota bacterium]